MAVNFSTSTTLKMIDRLSGPLSRMQKKMDRFKRSFRSINRAAAASQNMGRAIVRSVAVPALAAAGNSIRVTTNFQQAMNQVEAKLGNISQGTLDQLNDKAKQLGATTQFSASQAGQGMQFLAQAGLDAEQILASITGQLQLAAAGTLELGQAADISTNIMSQFGMSFDSAGKNLQRMNDVLAVTAASTNTDIIEMSEAMKQAGPVAKAFGLDIESAASVIGVLANSGIKGSDAGTGLKQMFQKMVAPAGKSAQVMEKLAIKQSDLFKRTKAGQLEFLGMANALTKFKDANADASDLFQIFGRAAPKLFALMQQGVEPIAALEGKLRDAGGAAAHMAKVQMKGLPGITARARSAFEALNIALTESGALDPLIKGLEKVTKWMGELSKQPERLRKFAKVAAIIGGVGVALFAFGTVALSVTAIMAPFLAVMATAAVAGTTMAAVMSPLIVTFGTVALVVAGVATAGVLLYKNWGRITKFFNDKMPNAVKLFKSAMRSAKVAAAVFGARVMRIKKDLGPVFKFLGKVAVFQLKRLDTALGILANMPEIIKASWGGLKEFFARIFDGILLKYQAVQTKVLQGAVLMARALNNPMAGALQQTLAAQQNQATLQSRAREKLDINITGAVDGVNRLGIDSSSDNRTGLIGNVGYTTSAIGF